MGKREIGKKEKKEVKGTKISKEVQEIMREKEEKKEESVVKEEKECVFCKIVRKELPAEIVYESQNFVAFPDVRPRVEGHTIIIPKKHYVTLMDMPSSLGGELVDVLKRVFEIKTKQGAEGFNLVMNNFPAAGQFVMHAHIHLLPRKTQDGKGLGL
ncbi:MAG: HIT domain-containing protein [Candidatus Pacearchaeota archaeon]